MPNTPFEKETIEMFEKSFKNGSWWEDANNNKYSPAHAIKSFLLSRLHTLSALYRKEIEEMTFKMDVKDYLPKLKAWQGGYDRPFDDGYAQAKKDIINEIIK